jgi:hypothetical protein
MCQHDSTAHARDATVEVSSCPRTLHQRSEQHCGLQRLVLAIFCAYTRDTTTPACFQPRFRPLYNQGCCAVLNLCICFHSHAQSVRHHYGQPRSSPLYSMIHAMSVTPSLVTVSYCPKPSARNVCLRKRMRRDQPDHSCSAMCTAPAHKLTGHADSKPCALLRHASTSAVMSQLRQPQLRLLHAQLHASALLSL